MVAWRMKNLRREPLRIVRHRALSKIKKMKGATQDAHRFYAQLHQGTFSTQAQNRIFFHRSIHRFWRKIFWESPSLREAGEGKPPAEPRSLERSRKTPPSPCFSPVRPRGKFAGLLDDDRKACPLRDVLEEGILSSIPNTELNGHKDCWLANTTTSRFTASNRRRC